MFRVVENLERHAFRFCGDGVEARLHVFKEFVGVFGCNYDCDVEADAVKRVRGLQLSGHFWGDEWIESSERQVDEARAEISRVELEICKEKDRCSLT